jgi:hypothetical protein
MQVGNRVIMLVYLEKANEHLKQIETEDDVALLQKYLASIK